MYAFLDSGFRFFSAAKNVLIENKCQRKPKVAIKYGQSRDTCNVRHRRSDNTMSKSLKIPKELSKAVYQRRTDITMTKSTKVYQSYTILTTITGLLSTGVHYTCLINWSL